MDHLYTITVDHEQVIEYPLPLHDCIEIKEMIEARQPMAVVIVDMVDKPSMYDFIDVT